MAADLGLIDLTLNEEFRPDRPQSRFRSLAEMFKSSSILGERDSRFSLNKDVRDKLFYIDLFGTRLNDPDGENPNHCCCCGIGLTPLNRVYNLCEGCNVPLRDTREFDF